MIKPGELVYLLDSADTLIPATVHEVHEITQTLPNGETYVDVMLEVTDKDGNRSDVSAYGTIRVPFLPEVLKSVAA